ncbi:restriction endonuclease [Micromonospora sp. ATA32]|nr:restriction endonuclease [Micromonospora sp. ATA32]
MQGRPEGAPPPRQVEDWAAAEANAVAWMKWLGHRDARPTKPGADGGIDVITMGAFAQVKWYGKPVGPRPLRELAGARANRPGTLYFFVNNRYTPAALAYAEEVGMAAFVYSPADGMIAPVSSAARRPSSRPYTAAAWASGVPVPRQVRQSRHSTGKGVGPPGRRRRRAPIREAIPAAGPEGIRLRPGSSEDRRTTRRRPPPSMSLLSIASPTIR